MKKINNILKFTIAITIILNACNSYAYALKRNFSKPKTQNSPQMKITKKYISSESSQSDISDSTMPDNPCKESQKFSLEVTDETEEIKSPTPISPHRSSSTDFESSDSPQNTVSAIQHSESQKLRLYLESLMEQESEEEFCEDYQEADYDYEDAILNAAFDEESLEISKNVCANRLVITPFNITDYFDIGIYNHWCIDNLFCKMLHISPKEAFYAFNPILPKKVLQDYLISIKENCLKYLDIPHTKVTNMLNLFDMIIIDPSIQTDKKAFLNYHRWIILKHPKTVTHDIYINRKFVNQKIQSHPDVVQEMTYFALYPG